MPEFRFKTLAIFTVNAESEEEALQILVNATGEELGVINKQHFGSFRKSEILRYNTMRKFESLQPVTSVERRKHVRELMEKYGIEVEKDFNDYR